MYIFVGILLIVSVFIIIMSRETHILVSEHVDYAEDVPPAKTFKAIQLSDIHVNMNNIRPEKIRFVIGSEKPDAIFLTGDYINTQLDIKKFLKYIADAGIVDFAKAHKNVYLCMGNHDVKALKNVKCGMKQLSAAITHEGIEVLRNTTALLKHSGRFISITGFKDISESVNDLSFIPQQGYSLKIALAHNPDTCIDVPFKAFDYMLSGHFHGGQIWAPFSIEYRLFRHERLAKLGVRKGSHVINGINLYISRGLGCVFVPLRFMSRPEITIFKFPLR